MIETGNTAVAFMACTEPACNGRERWVILHRPKYLPLIESRCCATTTTTTNSALALFIAQCSN
jgi:hypothetical protein